MPLVGFGTFMLGGENCRNAAAAAIQSGYRMVEEAYGNEKDIDERIEKNGIDRCGDGAALRAGQTGAAHWENGKHRNCGVFADVVGRQNEECFIAGCHWWQGALLKLLADTECHLTLFIRYAKDEIPDEIDGDHNLDNEPAQIPNRKATDVVEASSLNDTVLRPGYLSEGDEDDAVLTVKGEAAKGYTTSIPALVKFAVRLILDDRLYSRRASASRAMP